MAFLIPDDSSDLKSLFKEGGMGNKRLRLDQVVYPQLLSSYEVGQGRFWVPKAISMDDDRNVFDTMPVKLKEVYTTNLQWQIAADSLQVHGLGDVILSQCNNIELFYALMWQQGEELNHSASYEFIVSSMYNDPKTIHDGADKNPLIQERIKAYDDMYDNAKGDLDIIDQCFMIVTMEAISFITSFLVTLALNKEMDNKLNGTQLQIQKIAADEAGHQQLFTAIIRILTDQGKVTTHHKKRFLDTIYDIYSHEMDYVKNLYKICGLTHLHPDNFEPLLKHKINQLCKGLRVDTPFDKLANPDTYPTINFYKNQISLNIINNADQETPNGVYVNDVLINDLGVFIDAE